MHKRLRSWKRSLGNAISQQQTLPIRGSKSLRTTKTFTNGFESLRMPWKKTFASQLRLQDKVRHQLTLAHRNRTETNFDDELAAKFDKKKKKSFQSVCFPRLSKGQARGELASKSSLLGSFISEMRFHIRSLDNMRFHIRSLDKMRFHIRSLDNMRFHIRSLDKMRFHIRSLDKMRFHIRSLDNMRFHIRSLDNMRFHIRSLDNMRFHIRSLDKMRFHIRSLDNMSFHIWSLDKKQLPLQEQVTTRSFQEQLVPAECRQNSLTPRTSTSLLSKSSLEAETFRKATSQTAAWKQPLSARQLPSQQLGRRDLQKRQLPRQQLGREPCREQLARHFAVAAWKTVAGKALCLRSSTDSSFAA